MLYITTSLNTIKYYFKPKNLDFKINDLLDEFKNVCCHKVNTTVLFGKLAKNVILEAK